MRFPPPTPPATPHRVLVTGAGILTALGRGWQANAEGFRIGRPAFRAVTRFDVSRQRARLAAEVDVPADLPATKVPARQLQRWDRAATMLWLAAHEAWTQAGWTAAQPLPFILGTTGGGMTLGEQYLCHALQPPFSLRHQPTRITHYQMHRQALQVAEALGFTGPVTLLVNACASGANAIGLAWELVRTGRARRVLAGGYDALCQLTFAGFDSLQALSPTPCQPFDAQRSGLSLGEGAAILALESEEHARTRGVPVLGEILGYGAATDLYHLTQPHPEGRAALASMTAACQSAGITPDQVDYVNAHGTATLHNDATEALAIQRWAGARAAALPVSSTKACIGHLLGAAGAVEAVVALMALRGQWLPPQANLRTPDPACTFPLVREPTAAPLKVVLSNSFGFGGANATLVLGRKP